MDRIEEIIKKLQKWEKEYNEAKADYNQAVMEYEDSHPEFHKNLSEAWEDTNAIFEQIEDDFNKEEKAASKEKEPKKTIDMAKAKAKRENARQKAYQEYLDIRDAMIDKAIEKELPSDLTDYFHEMRNKFNKVKKEKATLEKKLNDFLDSEIFKAKIIH
ncbi:hypothetical protein ACFQO1_03395 [Jejudonia soesokkakensis]|uniref:Uncharacterized protein n=1 Tax=Jejudonia soesokkakensis TaxID=1323432 RepID=A0ABW2MTT4_9FLAO